MSYARPLADLDRVPWATLEANGRAEDVPRLLRGIASGDKATRDRAWTEWWDVLYHQGSTYEATAAAVPFLVGIVESSECPDRNEILTALSELASATAPSPGWARPKGARDVYENLASAVSCFVELLSTERAPERLHAAILLRFLGHLRFETCLPLARAIAIESEPSVRAAMLFALGELLEHPELGVFHAAFDTTTDPLARAIAASFLLRWMGDDARDEHIHAVCRVLYRDRHGGPEDGLPVWLDSHHFERSLETSARAGEALQQVNTGRFIDEAPK